MPYYSVLYSYTHEDYIIVEATSQENALEIVAANFHPDIKDARVHSAEEYELPQDVKDKITQRNENNKKALN